jgi:cytochrome P450
MLISLVLLSTSAVIMSFCSFTYSVSFFNMLTATSMWLPVAISLVSWFLSSVVYRLYFHPLARFPGPKLAALTTWYEAYYDVIKKGRYLWKIEDMHRSYGITPCACLLLFSARVHTADFETPFAASIGPIVRVGPNELHVRDPDYYDQLYNQQKKLDKYGYYYSMVATPLAGFGTIRADIHRMRRAALNPFFSAQAVASFRPLMNDLTNRLCARMEAVAAHNEPVPLFYAYRCLTVDVISEFAFGGQMGLIDREDWGREFYAAWRALWDSSPLIRQLPFMLPLMMIMPRWLTALLNPKGLEVVDLFARIDAYMDQLLKLDAQAIKARPHRTAMWEVAHAGSLPPEERSLKRLSLEAVAVLGGGFETTASALTLGTFLILNNPQVHRKLVQELDQAILDSKVILPWQQLEKLPYLSCVIKETLRYMNFSHTLSKCIYVPVR